jgi:FkbM family methyltransferase
MHDLVPGDIISGGIAFCGFYELELTRAIARLAPTGTLLVDVGANMGYFSLLWAGLNLGARVIAFEASPRNIKSLENNILRNSLGDRIAVVPKAVGHKSCVTHFDIGPTEQTGWGGISNKTSAHDVEVALVRLDDELPDVNIDVLKIDVEGADTWVLYGCEQLLKKKKIRKIFFELNSVRMAEFGIGANDAIDFLDSVGYDCRQFGNGCGEWVASPRIQDKRASTQG